MTGSNTNNKFKAARENKDFVQDVNSDAADPMPASRERTAVPAYAERSRPIAGGR